MTNDRKPPSGLNLPIAGVVVALLLVVVGVLLASRRDEKLPSIYGRRRGGEAGRSVNGTAVLAELFRASGRRVTTLNRFSPKLDQSDTIVWCPDDFDPPDHERREYLESWLQNGNGRTVIYVGRDYDASLDYWERIALQIPAALGPEALHRQAEARAAWESARSKMPTDKYARWFTVRRDRPPAKIDDLTGPWAEGIDAQQTNIHLEGRLTVPSAAEVDFLNEDTILPTSETLLASGSDAIAFRLTDNRDFGDGQIIVVANGSFLLNYPLVNHEHRKLAARLINECSPQGKVVFIESGPGGPRILEKEPTGGFPTALELLKVWPLNALLLHLTVLGIVVCLARSPIFGRPRELPADSPTDFGKHVAALGKLLARSRDRNYAQARLAHYRQIAERKSGRSHLKTRK
jgi:hypothetical protein